MCGFYEKLLITWVLSVKIIQNQSIVMNMYECSKGLTFQLCTLQKCLTLFGFILRVCWSTGLLFHRAILMSGSALSPWAMVREPARFARQVAKHANCSPELPHPHLLKCLRERPLDALLSTPIDVPEFSTAFGPSVDGVVIDNGNPESRSSSNQGTFLTCFL